ncbi:type II toxin-antitoxin system Phd/YefM family antitoxin [Thermosulfurimonas sp.]|uniref:type II toxin-antitoxin system Phd/YefM family antitoxin n=1 Tax=Thermosulfurimonas sp. TaxID=2080236 RepID=UPI0034240BB9
MAPIILEKNGKKEFVILSYEEFLKLKEIAEDYEDLKALREAKEEEKDKPGYSLEEVKKILNI